MFLLIAPATTCLWPFPPSSPPSLPLLPLPHSLLLLPFSLPASSPLLYSSLPPFQSLHPLPLSLLPLPSLPAAEPSAREHPGRAISRPCQSPPGAFPAEALTSGRTSATTNEGWKPTARRGRPGVAAVWKGCAGGRMHGRQWTWFYRLSLGEPLGNPLATPWQPFGNRLSNRYLLKSCLRPGSGRLASPVADSRRRVIAPPS